MRLAHAHAAFVVALLLAVPVQANSWDTVLLRHDFDTASGPANMPDPSVWVVNHPSSSWWTQGRTFFPSPIHHPTAPLPSVNGGIVTIEHHLYNPYDLATTPWTFLGGEIHTVMEFQPTTATCFEARVRSNAYPDGLITSFFTYGYDGANADEIDFEFLSNKTNDDATYPTGDPVLTNPWNETVEKPSTVVPPGLDLTDWNVFRLYWYPGEKVEWTWMDPANGEQLLRTEAVPASVPDEPMSLYFNFWAPTASWGDAYAAGLQPATDAGGNQIFTYEIDYVEVRTPEPMTATSLGLGATWLLARRRRRRLRCSGAPKA